MDIEDPYLSQGSSAEDFDGEEEDIYSLENDDASHHHHQNRRHLHHRKLGQQRQQQWVDAPVAPYGAVYQPPIRQTGSFGAAIRASGSFGGAAIKASGSFGGGAVGMAGSLFRSVRTILILGALGAAAVLIRAHFLLAGGSVAASAVNGVFSDGGIAAVRLASGALALPHVTNLLLSEAVREALVAERAVLKEKVQRVVRTLPDGRPVATPRSAALLNPDGGRRLDVMDGVADETYAVRLMPTPGRRDLTEAAVERLAPCATVADVRLTSDAHGGDSSSALGGWGAEGSVVKRAGLTTDAVLILADDIAFTCEELDRGKSFSLSLF